MTAKQPEIQSLKEFKEKYPFSQNKLVWFLIPLVFLFEWFFNSSDKDSRDPEDKRLNIFLPPGIMTYSEFIQYYPWGTPEDFEKYRNT